MEFEAVITLDEEPWERLLMIEGVVHEGSSPNMNYGGLPDPGEPARFEPTNVEWSEHDPKGGEGDPMEWYEANDKEIDEQAMEEARKEARGGFGRY